MATDPAESTADASQLVCLPFVRLRLGCFNCGIDQNMLPKAKHQNKLRRVIAKAVAEQDLHMVNLCEVGGHKLGLENSIVHAQEIVSQRCLTRHYKAISCQAYMTTWQADHEPNDDTSVSLTLVGDPQVVELPSTLEPQLVIMVFTIAAAAHRQKTQPPHIRKPAHPHAAR